jgi:hypothetical protein
MPSSAEHKEKAQQHLDLLHSGSLTPEWEAIVAFYAALHLIERLCACENLHIVNHHDRLFWLNKHKKHGAIHADFVALTTRRESRATAPVASSRKRFPATPSANSSSAKTWRPSSATSSFISSRRPRPRRREPRLRQDPRTPHHNGRAGMRPLPRGRFNQP